MVIQIIIFITNNKLFACEIDNNGKTDTISIKGNSDIKCDDASDVDELLECIFDAFSIDSFADDNFDIVILDCGGDKKLVSYLNAKCLDAAKLSIISIEKLLPLLTWNKKQLDTGEEMIVAFADSCYKVACDENHVIRCTGKARKRKENVTLEMDDFGCLYYFNVENLRDGVVDFQALQENENTIVRLERENDELVRALHEKEKAFSVAMATAKVAEKKIVKLNAEIESWKARFPELTNGAIQMLEIMQSCKKELVKYQSESWDFSIKNAISKNKLNGAINALKSVIEEDININDFLGLFAVYEEGFGTATKIILFTTKGIYFDGARKYIDNCWQLPKPGFLQWSVISRFQRVYSNIVVIVLFGNPLLQFDFGGVVGNAVVNQIVEMGNKLKDVDV